MEKKIWGKKMNLFKRKKRDKIISLTPLIKMPHKKSLHAKKKTRTSLSSQALFSIQKRRQGSYLNRTLHE